MNCHAFFAFIDARRRWEEQQIPAPAPALLEKSVRCCATTNAGKRCRMKTSAADNLCALHRAHGDKKKPTLPPKQKESEDYDKFCRSYSNILRELYNVAGDEMADEFIRFKTLGRGRYNEFHARAFPKFRNHIE